METTKKLKVKLNELEDWNCCGATTYFHVDELLAYTLVARNLAMAEKQGLDVVAPCSACYKNMYFTRKHLNDEPDLADHINYALEEDNLQYKGTSKVKHLLELFSQDIGLEEVQKKVTRPLTGLNIAPYYGCQILRPRKDHENAEDSHILRRAAHSHWSYSGRFCYEAALLWRVINPYQSDCSPGDGP